MHPSQIQSGRTHGMQSIDAVLAGLVAQGVVAPEDALEKAADKNSFANIPAVAAALEGGRA